MPKNPKAAPLNIRLSTPELRYILDHSGASLLVVAEEFADVGGQIKAETGLTTIAVGLITQAAHAESILAEGKADAVSLARALLYDPRWPWHAAAALGEQVFAPPQYWRSQPREHKELFGTTRLGQR